MFITKITSPKTRNRKKKRIRRVDGRRTPGYDLYIATETPVAAKPEDDMTTLRHEAAEAGDMVQVAGGQYRVYYRDSAGRTRPGVAGTQEECESHARSYVGPEGTRTEEVDRVSFRGPPIDRGPGLTMAPGLLAWVALAEE